MSFKGVKEGFQKDLAEIQNADLVKEEFIINSSQDSHIVLKDGTKVINMCSNNYLGLANHKDVIEAAKDSFDYWGFGLASVRFICGTQSIHKKLENRLTKFLLTEDTILYPSCFDANAGLFETILNENDAVISDELNHASIIDGVRLCKAKRFRYKNNDMLDLEDKLIAAKDIGARRILITTDGVFSMNGTIVKLDKICELADKYGAIVHHDDCHAVGFMGENGRGVHEYFNVIEKVDIITGTLGKALGGCSGGYTSGRKEIIAILRQKSRPYLFSNTLAPAICAATIKVLDILSSSKKLINKLEQNTKYFRQNLKKAGFNINEGNHPIIAIIFGDAKIVKKISSSLIERGIFVVGFFFPVVPRGQARIRMQISAAHSKSDLDKVILNLTQVYKSLQI